MSTIKQLPSGNYNTLVYDFTDPNGKRHYKSITAPSKKEVKLLVAEFLASREERKEAPDITVRTAIKQYVEAKNNVLSPSTLRGYDVILRNRMKRIMDTPISKLSLSDIQLAVNDDSEKLTPKTVRNTSSLVRSAILFAAPNFSYKVTLPQKIKSEIKIPTEEEMLCIFKKAKGTNLETAIYLAAMCGMRRSEIVALKWSDVDFKNGIINIRQAAVPDRKNKTVIKTTKSTSSTRSIKVFTPVLNHLKNLPRNTEAVQEFTSPNSITDGFAELLKRNGIPHYRFHDLRHYAVSTMLLLNIPKKYIADYVGHETEHMIDTVYGHIMRDKKDDLMDVVNAHFCDFSAQMQNEMQNE